MMTYVQPHKTRLPFFSFFLKKKNRRCLTAVNVFFYLFFNSYQRKERKKLYVKQAFKVSLSVRWMQHSISRFRKRQSWAEDATTASLPQTIFFFYKCADLTNTCSRQRQEISMLHRRCLFLWVFFSTFVKRSNEFRLTCHLVIWHCQFRHPTFRTYHLCFVFSPFSSLFVRCFSDMRRTHFSAGKWFHTIWQLFIFYPACKSCIEQFKQKLCLLFFSHRTSSVTVMNLTICLYPNALSFALCWNEISGSWPLFGGNKELPIKGCLLLLVSS